MDNDFPLRNAKRAVESHLKDSGLVYTILRPSYFTEFWFSPAVGFDVADAKAQIYGSGENPISWISFKDVAQFAVESLDNPAAQNVTLELGGPEALSPLQVVQGDRGCHALQCNNSCALKVGVRDLGEPNRSPSPEAQPGVDLREAG